ncbi:MAG: FAD-dependent oxidoreductase [Dehalococcoidia bacterium]|nr:FAD-dependent oxidoreductase [Dehalococcoidia bacterium]
MARTRYDRLFAPGRIGTLELKNRIVYPPMGTNVCMGGEVSDRLLAYHEARAKGGAAMVIVENANVDSAGAAGLPLGLNIDDDKCIPGFKKLADVIKKNGARACLQIYHGSFWIKPDQRPVMGAEIPGEFSVADVEYVISRFVQAARRSQEAGFDAIEIHGANINGQTQFRSAVWNRLKHKYGADVRDGRKSLENRARFMVDTLKAVRKEVGKKFPLWCRTSIFEVYYVAHGDIADFGVTLPETMVHVPMFVNAGADAIHLSQGGFYDYAWQYYTMCPVEAHGEAPYLELVAQVKKVSPVPVIAAARLTPEIGDKAIRTGKLDFVAMGRRIQVDPELPNKLAAGKEDDIRPCIHCNHCIETLAWADGVACVVNPALAREKEYEIKKAPKAKKVLVAGGGPGGMEAARVAALRGHDVTLYEKEKRLGGQLIPASVPPHKSELLDFAEYQARQLKKAKVKVELGKTLTPEEVKKVKPDAVIIATGVKPLDPASEVPGLDTLSNVVYAEDVLTGRAQVGERVVIIGGDLVGCETAEYLADIGKDVTVMRRSRFMADKLNPDMRMLLIDRLVQKGVRLVPGVQYMQATDSDIRVHVRGGITSMAEIACDAMKNFPADTFVLATGSTPNNELADALKKQKVEVHSIGDCVQPRRILEAVKEGWQVASQI